MGRNPSPCLPDAQPLPRSFGERWEGVLDIILFKKTRPDERIGSFANYFGRLKYSSRESSSAEKKMTQIRFFALIPIENIFNSLAVLSLAIRLFQKLDIGKHIPKSVVNAY